MDSRGANYHRLESRDLKDTKLSFGIDTSGKNAYTKFLSRLLSTLSRNTVINSSSSLCVHARARCRAVHVPIQRCKQLGCPSRREYYKIVKSFVRVDYWNLTHLDYRVSDIAYQEKVFDVH